GGAGRAVPPDDVQDDVHIALVVVDVDVAVAPHLDDDEVGDVHARWEVEIRGHGPAHVARVNREEAGRRGGNGGDVQDNRGRAAGGHATGARDLHGAALAGAQAASGTSSAVPGVEDARRRQRIELRLQGRGLHGQ